MSSESWWIRRNLCRNVPGFPVPKKSPRWRRARHNFAAIIDFICDHVRMSRKIIVTLLITWIAPSARAQSMDPAVRELIERMQARIDGLEKRLAELEHEKGTPAPRPSPAEAVHMTHDQAAGAVAAGESAPSYPSLKINGFSDINFSSSNLHAPAAGFGGATL